MRTLHLYGIDHSRAPIDVREELAFSSAEIREVLPRLLSQEGALTGNGGVAEALLLSTCNRTEIYLAVEGEISSYPLAAIQNCRPGIRILDDQCLRYHFHGRQAFAHLFAVAASLRSQVPGDTQIAKQLAVSAQIAREAGTMGPLLELATAAALRSAKRVRRETGLMAGRSGTGPAVLQCIRRLVPGQSRPLRPVRVLLLGAGTMAEEVACHLSGSGAAGPGRGVDSRNVEIAGVWARDRQKANRFAERYGIPAFTNRQATRALAAVDAVVGACRGRVALLGEAVLGECLQTRTNPLVVVDLGVPRNLDPTLAGRDGLYAVFLDQLHGQMRERARHRAGAIEKAEFILAEELERFEQRMARWPLQPFRTEVYSTIEQVLGRWRMQQPDAVRQLRVALHRTLEQTFRSVIPGSHAAIHGKQSSPANVGR